MSIKAIIDAEVTDKTLEVRHKGAVYKLTGRPDINIIGSSIMSEAEVIDRKVNHYNNVTGSKYGFDKKLVLSVAMVAATLEHEDDPERRYDETEIAMLATKDSGLFLKLSAVAAQVCGITSEDNASRTVDALGMGESENSEAEPSENSTDES